MTSVTGNPNLRFHFEFEMGDFNIIVFLLFQVWNQTLLCMFLRKIIRVRCQVSRQMIQTISYGLHGFSLLCVVFISLFNRLVDNSGSTGSSSSGRNINTSTEPSVQYPWNLTFDLYQKHWAGQSVVIFVDVGNMKELETFRALEAWLAFQRTLFSCTLPKQPSSIFIFNTRCLKFFKPGCIYHFCATTVLQCASRKEGHRKCLR